MAGGNLIEALVIIQYTVLVVRSGHIGNSGIKGSMYKVMKTVYL